MTRENFVSKFDSLTEAVEYEHATLNSGREFLPACAVTVLDGGEPTPEYWAWICGQVDEEENDAE